MIYTRIILCAFILLAFIYYVMIVGQLWGAWRITARKITFPKLCVPFYYWAVSQKVNKPKQKSQ